MLAAERGDAEVKRGVIHEDEYVGLLRQQCFFGNTEITSHFAHVLEHGRKTHEGHVTDMLIEMTPGFGHFVAS